MLTTSTIATISLALTCLLMLWVMIILVKTDRTLRNVEEGLVSVSDALENLTQVQKSFLSSLRNIEKQSSPQDDGK